MDKCYKCKAEAVRTLDGDPMCERHSDQWVEGERMAANDNVRRRQSVPQENQQRSSQWGRGAWGHF